MPGRWQAEMTRLVEERNTTLLQSIARQRQDYNDTQSWTLSSRLSLKWKQMSSTRHKRNQKMK